MHTRSIVVDFTIFFLPIFFCSSSTAHRTRSSHPHSVRPPFQIPCGLVILASKKRKAKQRKEKQKPVSLPCLPATAHVPLDRHLFFASLIFLASEKNKGKKERNRNHGSPSWIAPSLDATAWSLAPSLGRARLEARADSPWSCYPSDRTCPCIAPCFFGKSKKKKTEQKKWK